MSWVIRARISTLVRMERPLIRPDEIYLASFPFGDTARMKLRPVLTLTGSARTVPEVLVAYISSVIPHPLLTSDIVLDPANAEHQSTNLKAKSALRLHKLPTIHMSAVVRRLGGLSATTISEVDQKLRAVLNL
jgi:hypothetical protein